MRFSARLFGLVSACILLVNCALVKPVYSKNDRLDVLKQQVKNADVDEGDELIVCPEDPQTKLRAVVVPDMYRTGIISAHFGNRTELIVLEECVKKYDKNNKRCTVERVIPEANTREEELAKRKLFSRRQILFVNRKGQYVDKDGVRLTEHRWSKPTTVNACDEIVPEMATSSIID